MQEDHEQKQSNVQEDEFGIGYEPTRPGILLLDIAGFAAVIKYCFGKIEKHRRAPAISKILSFPDIEEIYCNKRTGRRVLCEQDCLEHEHEKRTAILLTEFNYDVVFAPKGLFMRHEKKFDVFLMRDRFIIKADMKAITSTQPLTVADRIKEGCEQASVVIVNICSDIGKKKLIEGLRSASYKNQLLKEIILIRKNKHNRLPKSLIESDRIFEVLK